MYISNSSYTNTVCYCTTIQLHDIDWKMANIHDLYNKYSSTQFSDQFCNFPYSYYIVFRRSETSDDLSVHLSALKHKIAQKGQNCSFCDCAGSVWISLGMSQPVKREHHFPKSKVDCLYIYI